MKDFRHLPDVTTLVLKVDACIGCGACVEVCPHRVFEVRDRKAVIVDRDGCMECGACALNCMFNAINLTKGTGCLGAIIKEDILKIRAKGTGCGCGESGSKAASGCC